MAKYKIGQKVRLRADLEYEKWYGDHWVNNAIYGKRGKLVTIVNIDDHRNLAVYTMKELPGFTGVTELMIDDSSNLINFLKELQCTK